MRKSSSMLNLSASLARIRFDKLLLKRSHEQLNLKRSHKELLHTVRENSIAKARRDATYSMNQEIKKVVFKKSMRVLLGSYPKDDRKIVTEESDFLEIESSIQSY